MEEESSSSPCVLAARYEFGFDGATGTGIACSHVQPCDLPLGDSSEYLHFEGEKENQGRHLKLHYTKICQ